MGQKLCLVVKLTRDWKGLENDARKEIMNNWEENMIRNDQGTSYLRFGKIVIIKEWPINSLHKIPQEIVRRIERGK